MDRELKLNAREIPRVLFLGNGLLRLSGGGNWDEVLRELRLEHQPAPDLSEVPYAMQPEALCGVDVEEVQRRTANAIRDIDMPHDIMKGLLSIPFDAILTTNYTYEIESILSGKPWTDTMRLKAFTALDGNARVRHNMCICSLVPCSDQRVVPVFHIHGERMRKHSLILSYYSYANAVSRLIALNKKRGNEYFEKQETGEEISVLSWLDYFILGEVYAVGFGFDTSEFDVWWAIERKAREKAVHGKLHAIMTEKQMAGKPQKVLFDAMGVDIQNYSLETYYPRVYAEALNDLQKNFGRIIAEKEK